MTFGFPAYHTDRYSAADKGADLRSAVRQALAALSWPVKEEAADRLVASTGMNWRSWGEKVYIDFLPEDSISVASKCAFPLQCVDWGKNKANVKEFMAELKNHV